MDEGSEQTNNYNTFDDVPIRGISPETKSLLSAYLNPTKLFPAPPPTDLPRDWRGLATLTSMPAELLPAANASSDPTGYVLSYWAKQSIETANVGLLLKYFEQIDRYDVLDDTKHSLTADSKTYHRIAETKTIISNRPVITSKPSADDSVLTVHDAQLSELGFVSPQFYDAFVLFADEDIDFATELIERMEAFGFKLCVKDRDLLGGLTFEHTAIMTLISKRCNRLIVIISPDFLQSPANTFFVDFAQAIGIEQGRSKIVPCLYKSCVLPPQLSYYFLLNYERSGRLVNFWDKLKDSLKVSQSPRLTIQEIDSSSNKSVIAVSNNARIPPRAICDTNYSMAKKSVTTVNNHNLNTSKNRLYSSTENIPHELRPQNTSESNTNYSPMFSSISDLTNSVEKPMKDKKNKWYKKILTFNTNSLKTENENKKKKKWNWKKPIPVIAE